MPHIPKSHNPGVNNLEPNTQQKLLTFQLQTPEFCIKLSQIQNTNTINHNPLHNNNHIFFHANNNHNNNNHEDESEKDHFNSKGQELSSSNTNDIQHQHSNILLNNNNNINNNHNNNNHNINNNCNNTNVNPINTYLSNEAFTFTDSFSVHNSKSASASASESSNDILPIPGSSEESITLVSDNQLNSNPSTPSNSSGTMESMETMEPLEPDNDNNEQASPSPIPIPIPISTSTYSSLSSQSHSHSHSHEPINLPLSLPVTVDSNNNNNNINNSSNNSYSYSMPPPSKLIKFSNSNPNNLNSISNLSSHNNSNDNISGSLGVGPVSPISSTAYDNNNTNSNDIDSHSPLSTVNSSSPLIDLSKNNKNNSDTHNSPSSMEVDLSVINSNSLGLTLPAPLIVRSPRPSRLSQSININSNSNPSSNSLILNSNLEICINRISQQSTGSSGTGTGSLVPLSVSGSPKSSSSANGNVNGNGFSQVQGQAIRSPHAIASYNPNSTNNNLNNETNELSPCLTPGTPTFNSFHLDASNSLNDPFWTKKTNIITPSFRLVNQEDKLKSSVLSTGSVSPLSSPSHSPSAAASLVLSVPIVSSNPIPSSSLPTCKVPRQSRNIKPPNRFSDSITANPQSSLRRVPNPNPNNHPGSTYTSSARFIPSPVISSSDPTQPIVPPSSPLISEPSAAATTNPIVPVPSSSDIPGPSSLLENSSQNHDETELEDLSDEALFYRHSRCLHELKREYIFSTDRLHRMKKVSSTPRSQSSSNSSRRNNSNRKNSISFPPSLSISPPPLAIDTSFQTNPDSNIRSPPLTSPSNPMNLDSASNQPEVGSPTSCISPNTVPRCSSGLNLDTNIQSEEIHSHSSLELSIRRNEIKDEKPPITSSPPPSPSPSASPFPSPSSSPSHSPSSNLKNVNPQTSPSLASPSPIQYPKTSLATLGLEGFEIFLKEWVKPPLPFDITTPLTFNYDHDARPYKRPNYYIVCTSDLIKQNHLKVEVSAENAGNNSISPMATPRRRPSPNLSPTTQNTQNATSSPLSSPAAVSTRPKSFRRIANSLLTPNNARNNTSRSPSTSPLPGNPSGNVTNPTSTPQPQAPAPTVLRSPSRRRVAPPLRVLDDNFVTALTKTHPSVTNSQLKIHEKENAQSSLLTGRKRKLLLSPEVLSSSSSSSNFTLSSNSTSTSDHSSTSLSNLDKTGSLSGPGMNTTSTAQVARRSLFDNSVSTEHFSINLKIRYLQLLKKKKTFSGSSDATIESSNPIITNPLSLESSTSSAQGAAATLSANNNNNSSPGSTVSSSLITNINNSPIPIATVSPSPTNGSISVPSCSSPSSSPPSNNANSNNNLPPTILVQNSPVSVQPHWTIVPSMHPVSVPVSMPLAYPVNPIMLNQYQLTALAYMSQVSNANALAHHAQQQFFYQQQAQAQIKNNTNNNSNAASSPISIANIIIQSPSLIHSNSPSPSSTLTLINNSLPLNNNIGGSNNNVAPPSLT